MCLDKLEKFEVEGDYGYKVFRRGFEDNCLYGADIAIDIPRSIDKWLRSKDIWYEHDTFITTEWDKQPYPAGFHVFVTEEGAVIWAETRSTDVVRKVQFRGIVATGIQGTRRVIVVSEIRILPEREV